MLKKAHKSAHNLYCDRQNPCHICTVCNSAKTVSYLRESTVNICHKCQQSDGSAEGSECPQDSGDFVSEKRKAKLHRPFKKNRPLSIAQGKDLASGDHDKRCKNHHIKRKALSECKIKKKKDEIVRTQSVGDGEKDDNDDVETIIEYKNANFLNAKSSSSSTNSAPTNPEITGDSADLQKIHVFPRPVTCPVQECKKMIALDSVMLHFYFDHSKVPRLALNMNAILPREIFVKPSSLSAESRCIGIFLLQKKEDSDQNSDRGVISKDQSDCKSVLLMGARIHINQLPRSKKDHAVAFNNTTPTSGSDKDVFKNRSNLKVKVVQSDTYNAVAQDTFDDGENLLIWLCKLDDSPDYYSITLRSNEKKRSHNFTGEAVHVRDSQDALVTYQRSDCLVVTAAAANKLLDDLKQISVLINILE